MAEIFLPTNRYTANEPGRRLPLQVSVINVRNPKDKKETELAWSEEHGYVDNKGIFTVPELDHEETFTITVSLINENPPQSKDILVKVLKAKPKKEERAFDRIKTETFGEDGSYSTDFQVLHSKGKGYQCVLIITDKSPSLPPIIPDPKNPNKYVNRALHKTDKDGYLHIEFKAFTEKQRRIHVAIKGESGEGIFEELEGPKPKKKPAKLDLNAGFWANFKK